MTEPERRLAKVISAHLEETAHLLIACKRFLLEDERRIEREIASFERVTGHIIDDTGVA